MIAWRSPLIRRGRNSFERNSNKSLRIFEKGDDGGSVGGVDVG